MSKNGKITGFASVGYLYLLSLFSPLMALIVNIKNYHPKYSKWPLIFLITIFGSTVILRGDSDGYRHREFVGEYYSGMGLQQFLEELIYIIGLQPLNRSVDDIYIHVISYLVGSILESPGLFFVIVSFVFGYFYVSGISKILAEISPGKKSIYAHFFVFLFVIFNFVDNMNTVRTWTGAWVLFNGVFGYIKTKQKKYLFLMAFSWIFHISYVLMAIPAFIGVLAKKYRFKLVFAIYGLSFIVGVSESPIIGALNSFDLGARKVKAYYITEDDPRYASRIERALERDLNWYKEYGKHTAIRWGCNLILVSCFLFGLTNKDRMTYLERRLLLVGILFLIFSNMGSFIYAFHNRTLINAGLYIIAAYALMSTRGIVVHKSSAIWKRLLIIGIIVSFVPFIVFRFANITQFMSFYFVAFPFMAAIDGFNMSIREVIGILFLS